MTHMLYFPECLAEYDASILAQVPKKRHIKLDAGAPTPPDGWGLYFKEDTDASAITGVVFMVLLSAGLLLVIVWAARKHDIQIPPIAAYLVAVAALFGVWMGMRNRGVK